MSTLPAVPMQLRLRAAEGEADSNTVAWWLAELSAPEEPETLEASAGQLISDVNDMVRRFLTRHREDIALADQLVKALGQNTLPDIESVGTFFCRVATTALKVHELTSRSIRLVRIFPNFSEVQDLDKFHQAREDYIRWLGWFRSNWPWVDHERLRRSHASFERGNYRPMKGFLDELCDSANPRG